MADIQCHDIRMRGQRVHESDRPRAFEAEGARTDSEQGLIFL